MNKQVQAQSVVDFLKWKPEPLYADTLKKLPKSTKYNFKPRTRLNQGPVQLNKLPQSAWWAARRQDQLLRREGAMADLGWESQKVVLEDF